MHYFIIGIIIFLILCFVGKIFSDKAYSNLSIKEKLLLIQSLSNLNKYSASVLVATAVLLFAVMRRLNISGITIVFTFCVVAVIYIPAFTFFIYKEIKKIIPAPVSTASYYTISKIFILTALSILLISVFLYFSN